MLTISGGGLIHPSSVPELEKSLKELWSNLREQLEIEAEPNLIKRGKLLALRCLRERRRIEGLEVPDDFIPGCFHILADVPEIGWHPQYEKLLSNGTAR